MSCKYSKSSLLESIFSERTFLVFCLILIPILLYIGEDWRIKKLERKSIPDTLEVLTNTSASTYFIYRDEAKGYEYELLKLFAKSIKKPFKIKQVESLDSLHGLIARGEADLCIRPELICDDDESSYAYVGRKMASAMVLAQRIPPVAHSRKFIAEEEDLRGKTIYVEGDSRYEDYLRKLNERLGGTIDIRLADDSLATSEELIDLIARHHIDYALVDKTLAQISQHFYPKMDFRLQLGKKQKLSWICNKERTDLISALKTWADSLERVEGYRAIARKYFEQEQMSQKEKGRNWSGECEFITGNQLSPYDSLFREEAKRLGWDWKYLLAIAYQESNFRAKIIGYSGARGLMGIMPRTGRIYGASKEELLDPRVAVRVSVDCLMDVQKMFSDIADVEERCKFVLAGYNAGPAHVQDAQRLAKKYGYRTDVWTGNVGRFILLKRLPRYYKDPVCRYGYLRGHETSRYVEDITARVAFYRLRSTTHPLRAVALREQKE